MSEKILIASVTSEGNPQKGQKHRSSGNFSTEGVPGGYNKFEWRITKVDRDPKGIQFNVKKDKSAGIDPQEYGNLTDGSITDIKQIRNLYIADPRGSNGGTFVVEIYAINI